MYTQPPWLEQLLAVTGAQSIAHILLPPTIDKTALEAEWRELFPLAWTDYYRFELGWGSGAYGPYPYSMALAEIAFKLL